MVDILSSHAAVGLGKNLFPLFARALDLAPDFFDDKVRIHPLVDPMASRTIGNGSNDDDAKLDAKFSCADACAALPAADGTDRRAGDWHRRSHRVRLVTTFPTKHLFFSALSV